MAIDASDHGRPVVGASAIPGGYYARGNGRGELMNGGVFVYLAEIEFVDGVTEVFKGDVLLLR